MAIRIDGKALAAKVKARAAAGGRALSRRPGLAVILVGDDQAIVQMAATDRRSRRYSGLKVRLREGRRAR